MTTMLVVAKAPVIGQAKTRLAADLGGRDDLAAELAAAALLDTVAACSQAVGVKHCQLSLAGDLDYAVRGQELKQAVRGWTIVAQTQGSFGQRLAAAHAAVEGPRLQIGMDTPQVSPTLLIETAAGLADHDAVLAPALDGGWWALGLRDGSAARLLAGVAMSTPRTGEATRLALQAAGLRVGSATALIDVDHRDEAERVSREACTSQFAAVWRTVTAPDVAGVQ